jgi:hypothetical protein
MMGSWITPNTYTGVPRPESDLPIIINGHNIQRPAHFKNKAHARGFYLAMLLAAKKPIWSGIIILDISECIDHIMFSVPMEIQLNIDAVNPRVVAYDAMKFVPSFFEPGQVQLSHKDKGCKIRYLELLKRLI